MEESINVKKTLKVLKNNGVVIIPTDTVPGITTRYSNIAGLKRMMKIKGRSINKPFALLIGDISQISLVASKLPPKAISIINRYWPGGVTIILPAKKGLSKYIVSEQGVGLRMPNHKPLLNMLKVLGEPIAATSINISGEKPITDLSNLPAKFALSVDYVWKTQKKFGNVPSTVVAVSENGIKIIRQGHVKIK